MTMNRSKIAPFIVTGIVSVFVVGTVSAAAAQAVDGGAVYQQFLEAVTAAKWTPRPVC